MWMRVVHWRSSWINLVLLPLQIVVTLYRAQNALEGSELFGSTKQKFDLPSGMNCDSHRPDKVNYSFFALTLGLEGHT